jgi:hypothetical protein
LSPRIKPANSWGASAAGQIDGQINIVNTKTHLMSLTI